MVNLDLQERQNRRCSKELAVGLDWRASEGDQGSVCSAEGSFKQRKALVRKESADTQEYESCQLTTWTWT